MKKRLVFLTLLAGTFLYGKTHAQTKDWYKTETGGILTTYDEELMVMRQSAIDELENVYCAQELYSGSYVTIKLSKRDKYSNLIWTSTISQATTSVSFAGLVKVPGAASKVYMAVNYGSPGSFTAGILEFDTAGTNTGSSPTSSNQRIIDIATAGTKVYGLYSTSSTTVGLKAFNLSSISSAAAWTYSYTSASGLVMNPYKIAALNASGTVRVSFTAADQTTYLDSTRYHHVLVNENSTATPTLVAIRSTLCALSGYGGKVHPTGLVLNSAGSWAAATIVVGSAGLNDYISLDRMNLTASTTYNVTKTAPGVTAGTDVAIGNVYGVKLVDDPINSRTVLAFGYEANYAPLTTKYGAYAVMPLISNLTSPWTYSTNLTTHASYTQRGEVSALAVDANRNVIIATISGTQTSPGVNVYTKKLNVVSPAGSSLSNVTLSDIPNGIYNGVIAIHPFRVSNTLISSTPSGNTYATYDAYRLTGPGHTARYYREQTNFIPTDPGGEEGLVSAAPGLTQELAPAEEPAVVTDQPTPIISSVYPNPSFGKVNVRLNSETAKVKAELVDIYGVVRFTKEYTSNFSLELQNLGVARGNYTLVITQKGVSERRMISVQ
ncbi:MAG: T9SS type A sorting domain-containing protein [Bacteroidota bacterium]